jgi:opacity protein-like surface antigen
MRVKPAHSGVCSLALTLLLGAPQVLASGDPGFSYMESVTFTRSSAEKPSSKKQEYRLPVSPFAPGTHNLSVGVGQVFLLGSLGGEKGYEDAIGPALNYTYGVSDLFAFHSNFSYHSHSSGDLSIWNLSGGVRANLMYFDQLVPYAAIGLGFYQPSYITTDTRATVSSLLFGMQLGTGIDLMISNTVFFGAELNYNTMFDSSKKDSNGTTRSLGGAFASFMIHAGLTF